MENQSRRDFLKNAAVVTAGFTAGVADSNIFAAPASGSVLGANDKIRMGFIGVGNRGSELLGYFMQHPDCEVAALCDIYDPYLQRDRNKVNQRWIDMLGSKIPQLGEQFPTKPKLFSDFRKLLEDKSIDAVCIATPDHWHAIQTIEAIRAEKDVYCEKPLSITLLEGRKMIQAQAASKQVVAVGINRRGNIAYQNLIKEVHGGKLGQIIRGRGVYASNLFPKGIGKMKPEDPPKDFNWDIWLGPRAHRPYQYNIAPYFFRWWNDYSSQLGNWGVHHMDAMRWLMGETAPLYISAHGGKYVLDHDATINDTDVVTFEFASKKIMTYEILESTSEGGLFPYGELEIRGTQGMAFVNEAGYRIRPASAGQFQNWSRPFEEIVFDNQIRPVGGSSGMVRNFLDCVKSRNTPLCPLEEGHRSTSMAHLANIALIVKERLQWDPVNERFINNKKANDLLSYEYRKPWKL